MGRQIKKTLFILVVASICITFLIGARYHTSSLVIGARYHTSSLGNRRFLLFTSAGDKHNVKQWIGPSRKYDIVVIYYGDTQFTEDVDLVIHHKGTKFPNLKFFLSTHNIDAYDAAAIWDDALEANVDDINTLFGEMMLKNADIYSPCHTRVDFYKSLLKSDTGVDRRVEFIEMNTPMFTPKTLVDYMHLFGQSVTVWGTDVWYSTFCKQIDCNMRVSDKVCVLNPKTRADGSRDILNVVNFEIDEQNWSLFAVETLHIHPRPPKSAYVRGFFVKENRNGASKP